MSNLIHNARKQLELVRNGGFFCCQEVSTNEETLTGGELQGKEKPQTVRATNTKLVDYSQISMEEPLRMIANVCQKYPGSKVIIAHGGRQHPEDIKSAYYLAGLFEHIYLETGYGN